MSTATTTRQTSAGRVAARRRSRPSADPGREADLLAAAVAIAARGEPVTVRGLAREAGMSRDRVAYRRDRLRGEGRWPWPVLEGGWNGAREAQVKRTPALEAAILAAAAETNGRDGSYRIGARVGVSPETVRRVRKGLIAAGRWPWPLGPTGAADAESPAVLRADLPARIAALRPEDFAGLVRDERDDMANAYDYRRPPEPAPEDPAERERRERRELVAEWVRDWKKARREARRGR